MDTIIFLRLFVEIDTEELALEIAKKIVTLISEFAKVENQSIEKYWKIPEYYEIFFKLNSVQNIHRDYSSILEKLGSGWEPSNKYESIWNPGGESKFIIEEVRWAHLECDIE